MSTLLWLDHIFWRERGQKESKKTNQSLKSSRIPGPSNILFPSKLKKWSCSVITNYFKVIKIIIKKTYLVRKFYNKMKFKRYYEWKPTWDPSDEIYFLVFSSYAIFPIYLKYRVHFLVAAPGQFIEICLNQYQY